MKKNMTFVYKNKQVFEPNNNKTDENDFCTMRYQPILHQRKENRKEMKTKDYKLIYAGYKPKRKRKYTSF